LAHYQNKRIDIILPWRIGDAILNIPMLVCIKQLNEKYNDNNKIRIIAQPFLSKLYAPLDIFECKRLTVGRKTISHLKPADIAFFIETINVNWGYTAKTKYGLTNSFKKIIKFDYELPFMNINKFMDFLPEELVSFLQTKYGLSQYSISLFGILLELGYTAEQIIDTFNFSPDCLDLSNFNVFLNPVMNEKYVVFCMEAAYGKKGDANRRWDETYYIEIANRCFEDLNLKSIFVGINQDFKLPDEPNFIDLRKQLNLFQLAQVLKSSVCYIGNDTAPLHIANIMQRPSIGAYFMKHSLTDFSPVFPELNTQVYCPQAPEDLYEKFKQKFITKSKL
jgi:ADP-heptose:LPS heptosyltransferase